MRRGLALLFAICLSCKSESEAAPPAPCATVECSTSGVPPEACAEGFVPDGARGCTPVLPAAECTGNTFAAPGMSECAPAGVDACPAGLTLKPDGCASMVPLDCDENTIAVLGVAKCEPIAPCGSERFPKTAAPAVYVDASYTGTDSDGTEAKPYAKLTDALAAVDATKRSIALAEGTYELAARLDVPLEIVGVCPDKVRITAPKSATTPTMETFADVTLRNVTVTGHQIGVSVERGTTRLFASRVHGTGKEGIVVRASGTLELDRVVVSYAMGAGVAVQGGVAAITSSQIRDTLLNSDSSGGTAVGASTLTKKAARVTIERSVLSRNQRYGVFARGAELTLKDSQITDTSIPGGVEGAAVIAVSGGVPSQSKLSGVLIERATGLGVGAFDGTIEIDRTTIRGTRASGTGAYPLNFGVDPSTRKPVTAKVTRTLLTDSDDHGLFVKGAVVDVGSTIIRATKPASEEPSGRGILTQRSGTIVPTLNVHDSVIEDAAGAGVSVTAGTTTLERVAIRAIKTSPDKRFGFGAIAYIDNAAHRPTLVVRRSLIERVLEAGVIGFGSRLEIEGSVIRGVAARESVGFFGHGVHFSFDNASQLVSDGFVRGSFITDVLEVGVNVFMSNVEIDATTITGVNAGAHGIYGDGVTVSSVNNELYHPANMTMTRTKIASVARAAVSVFEAEAAVSKLLSTCNRIDIAVETFVGKAETKLSDGGENLCGCDAFAACRAITANVTPIAR